MSTNKLKDKYSAIIESTIHTFTAFLLSIAFSIVDVPVPTDFSKLEKVVCYLILFLVCDALVFLVFKEVNIIVQSCYKSDNLILGNTISFIFQMVLIVFVFGSFIYFMV